MPHEDGAAYHPLVATVSLGSPIVLDIYEKSRQDERDADCELPNGRKPQFRILQERRSLLVTRDRLYTDFLHGIAEIDRDEDLGPHSICNWFLLRGEDVLHKNGYTRGTRTSLTYRDVLKVSKMGNTIKFLGGK